MHVILLERVGRMGGIGDEVNVRDGFARNFLLPQGKALRASDANRKKFEAERQAIEARNAERRQQAQSVGDDLSGLAVIMVRQAGENGQLYGSVSARDIADALAEQGHTVSRGAIDLAGPIKTVGLHDVTVNLHAEVSVTVQVNVARSSDEAERQAAGEDLTVKSYDDEEDEQIAALEAEEEEALAAEEQGEDAAPAEAEEDEQQS